ncbi:PREDICTED: tetratricopeptide repeat protein 1-like isoform X1 [Priapulus caudatus]|uniref:Tetratricopeptide repeat protein 1-like isoform X1 n=1 Tax=Priapulus caudatus TaxID=37621 RepID=A0ABM1E1B7_PRICU|nr:PREDICTED: tetratricopeptide repeat protein 1-like isoform X1 [Priapulus caudatus]XP_014665988.1 PREDICTED: tetratricopeptide repeat protein 1-like isoform X1 [Priapulus caudatus]XP_014665989.1 PREDICTED: tetratricopeptide repeat protein 1-like isoform X1 [Priapulus caudatus]
MSQVIEETKAGLPTNEAIIDDLTKDLEQSLEGSGCAPEMANEDVPEIGSATTAVSGKEKESDAAFKSMVVNASEGEKDSNLDSSSDSDEPSRTEIEEVVIDEDYLKALEEKMTTEEKEENRKESQDLKSVGNKCFKEEKYKEAFDNYAHALQICPLSFFKDRSIMYSNRAATRLRLGQKEEAILDCSKAVELNPNYLKAVLRRAQTYELLEKLDEALEDYQKVVNLDPTNQEAREACLRLPHEIEERNEKLKTEMMGKLKDLGNMILRPFGFSTDNFNLEKDPNTGSYSVQFSQGAPPPNTPGNGK